LRPWKFLKKNPFSSFGDIRPNFFSSVFNILAFTGVAVMKGEVGIWCARANVG
jgi:hypothetical protein